mgnify:CR=1 FL=1
MGGIVGPAGMLLVGIVFLVLFIIALILILKNEKDAALPLWILVILLIPILGAVIYLIKYAMDRS